MVANGTVYSMTGVGTGSFYFGTDSSGYVNLSGGAFRFSHGAYASQFISNGNPYVGFANVNSGVIYFGNNGAQYISFDGANWKHGWRDECVRQ